MTSKFSSWFAFHYDKFTEFIQNEWNVYALVALGVFAAFTIAALTVTRMQYKRKRIVTPFIWFGIGVLLSGTILAFNAYDAGYEENWFITALSALHNSARMFVMDGSISDLVDKITDSYIISGKTAPSLTFYFLFGGAMYIIAPITTFGFILSFFKDVISYIRYTFFSAFTKRHVFSELNERSLSLAKSIDIRDNRKSAEKYEVRLNRLFERSKHLIKASEIIKKQLYYDEKGTPEYIQVAAEAVVAKMKTSDFDLNLKEVACAINSVLSESVTKLLVLNDYAEDVRPCIQARKIKILDIDVRREDSDNYFREKIEKSITQNTKEALFGDGLREAVFKKTLNALLVEVVCCYTDKLSYYLKAELEKNYDNIKKEREKIGKRKRKYKKWRRSRIVFTDILDKNEEEYLDLVEKAKELGAILFRKDINSMSLARKRRSRVTEYLRAKRLEAYDLKKKSVGDKKLRLDAYPSSFSPKEADKIRKLYNKLDNANDKRRKTDAGDLKFNFYLMGEDEAEKIRHATGIINDYRLRPDMKLYIFSDREESKCLLDSYGESEKDDIKIRVIRINDIRFLVYHNLDENGLELFEKSRESVTWQGEREISALIVGLGRYGMEVMKSLLWYCQLPGYNIRINAFDENEDTIDRFSALCPDITLGQDSHADGDMHYNVRLEKVKIGTKRFENKIKAIAEDEVSKPTYVFVALGSDSANLSTSIDIRRCLSGKNCDADIYTVIYDSNLKKRVTRVVQDGDIPRGMDSYNINIIGDMQSFYSCETVTASKLIEDGLAVHMGWPNSKHSSFYLNDYNFYSSIAKALHNHLRAEIIEYLNDKDIDEETKKKKFGNFMPSKDSAEPNWLEWVLRRTTTVKDAERLRKAFERFFADYPDNGAHPIYTQSATYDEVNARRSFDMKREHYEDKTEMTGAEADKELFGDSYANYCEALYKKECDRQEDKNDGYEHPRLRGELKVTSVLKMLLMLSNLDHIRWNAYMRTEGYVYSPSAPGGAKRKVYKQHKDIKPVSELKIADSIKDI